MQRKIENRKPRPYRRSRRIEKIEQSPDYRVVKMKCRMCGHEETKIEKVVSLPPYVCPRCYRLSVLPEKQSEGLPLDECIERINAGI